MQTRSSAPAVTAAATAATAPAYAGDAPQTRLVYAAPVHKLSLVVAARAWPLVKRTYRFIDLILARRGKRQLAVGAGARRLPDLPDEIWLAIKQFAAKELFKETEDLIVRGFHGDSDDGLLDELEDPKGFAFDSRIGGARLDLDHLSDCDTCSYFMFKQDGMVRTFAGSSNGHSKYISPMLSDHGLKLVCHHLVGGKTFDLRKVDTDLDGEALVALVDRTAPAGSSLLPATIMFGFVATAEPETVAAQGAPLPVGADGRFARLFELLPPGIKASHKKKHSRQGSSKARHDKAPGWKVLEVARKV